MSTTTRICKAERLGRSIGRGWCAFRRGELRLSNWLASKGVPVVGVTLVLWVVKLSVLGMLLYFAFWLAVWILGLMVAGWVAAATTTGGEEWPFIDLTELRKTSGYDPNLYNDTSHELYTDD